MNKNRTGFRFGLIFLLSVLLAACGGNGSSSTTVSDRATAESPQPGPSASLNARSLQDAEAQAKATPAASAPLESLRPGQLAAWEDYASGKVVRKVSNRLGVYRLYNTRTTAHFYTASQTELDTILATMPQFRLDGVAFQAAASYSPGLSPVYRFFNNQTGVHFYTISEVEKNNILATMPQFVLEGTAYHASLVSGQGLTPLYRFYMPSRGFHFYTASETEKNNIQANLSGTYTYEGIGYYVLDNNWSTLKLPHTGLGSNHCYGVDLLTSTDYFSSCDFGGGISISVNQDAQRTGFNAMQYRSVTYMLGQFLAAYPATSCVADAVTGLVWEGKTDDGGLRDKDNTYTNQGGGAATDASGYVAAVNAAALCGYTDWRLPTMLELHTLLNYSVTATPALDPTWFPNAILANYWSSDSQSSNTAWVLYTLPQVDPSQYLRSQNLSVRLVRGRLNASAPRLSLGTVAYGSDASNNVVNDAVTGLQWRRCLEGQTWNGSACTGTLNVYNHRGALVYGDTVSGGTSSWRLPNAREARSLLEINHAAPYLNALFPTPPMAVTWTTTADVTDPLVRAYALLTDVGRVAPANRSGFYPVRLIRIQP
ncbi:DUF1566 domain-containing protein [Hydrogenophaga sp. RWCD_12]|uniref:Lcl domain-containing protein n=1 Tax=Hydrogenophaga sp. RWCD_12 TaxID=3391190 RepID=UPI003984C844